MQNKLAEIFYKNKITCCFIKEIKEKKAKVLLFNNKEELVNFEQIIFVDNAFTKSENILELLKEKNELRNKLKEIFSDNNLFSLEKIWQDTFELIDESPIEAELLLELYFNRRPTDDEIAAFFRKILETQNYFQFIKTNYIQKFGIQQVEETKEKQKKLLEKQQKIQNFQNFLKKLLLSKIPIIQEIDKLSEEEKYWLENFKNYVIFDKCENKNIIEEVIKNNVPNQIPQLFEILVKNEIVEEDFFYELYRTNFPTNFSQQEIEEATKISHKKINSVDLTYLETFTIDSEETKDFDDAISVEKNSNKTILYIHIANVGSFITPETLLFKNSLKRMQTLYLPDKVIPMLPPILSEEKFSLKKGQPRETLTFKFEINFFQEVENFEIFLSKIIVKERLTYEEVDKELNKGNRFWNELYSLLMGFRNRRLQNGAVQVVLPEVSVKLLEDGKIVLKKMEFTKAHELVSEAMILTNYYTAKFLNQNNIPSIYRTQSEPYKVIPINNIIDALKQLKYLKKVEFSTVAKIHTGLGLDAYTTITSPIRRFLDLLNQYQLISFLNNFKPLNENEILMMLPEIEQNLSVCQYLQNRRTKYFILKYLQKFDEKIKGIVLETDKIKAKVYLEDFNITGILKDPTLQPETIIEVKIKSVNPFTEYIELEKINALQ